MADKEKRKKVDKAVKQVKRRNPELGGLSGGLVAIKRAAEKGKKKKNGRN